MNFDSNYKQQRKIIYAQLSLSLLFFLTFIYVTFVAFFYLCCALFFVKIFELFFMHFFLIC